MIGKAVVKSVVTCQTSKYVIFNQLSFAIVWMFGAAFGKTEDCRSQQGEKSTSRIKAVLTRII